METPTTPPTTPPAPTPEPQPRHHRRYDGFHPWRMFMGLFVMLIGLAFLAQQFGWTWIHIEDVWKIWPVFIILVGLSVLSRGHVLNTVLSIVLGIAILGVAAGVIWNQSAQHHATTTKTIAVPVDTAATAAVVHLQTGAAKVVLTGGSNGLIDGTFVSNLASLSTDAATINGSQDVTLKMNGSGWWWGGAKNQLDARLSSSFPLTLDINSGASDVNLDLSTVKASAVTVDSGAASVNVRLGDLVDTATLNISAGASSMVVTVPKTSGVDLELDAAVSDKTIPDFTLISGNHYQSPNYAASSKKISVVIHAGASSITVNRI